VPSASDTVLVVSQAYNAAGRVDTVTDSRGLVTKDFYDNLGRTTKTVAAYDGGSETSSTNVATEYTYDGDGHTLTVQADLPGGGHQTTQYVYGVTTSGGSDVNSNDFLAAVQYPDPSTGNPSSSQQESYTVNALGEQKTFTDRNGSVHTYSRDVLGRLTADAVTTLGSGVDGSVRRLETAYDTGGRPYLYTSFDAASGGNVVNQVQEVYNGLGQLITEYQAHAGTVNTSATPKVQYAYSQMSGGANHSRLVSITYPNGRVINYNYASGIDDSISRLTSLADSSATLEGYTYLGLDTLVKRAHPQPGVDLTYIKQTGESNGDAGDQYTGLDRFGRVVDQRWLVTSSGTATDRFKYGYDRDGNPLYRDNLVNSAFGELYHANGASNGYDSLHRLTAFARGTLSDDNSDGIPDTVASANHSQSWSLDALGNWGGVTTDGSTQTRTANDQNQITSVSGLTTPAYDGNGNMTTDQAGRTSVFDRWNRLVQVKSGSTVLVSYAYDPLSRRIVENPGTARDLYYSSAWQVLEERVGGTAQDQYVWSPVYVDALVERDRDADANSSNGLEERLYVQQDANWNVTALVDSAGNVQERYAYDPYGQAMPFAPNWSSRGTSSYGWVYLHQAGRYDATTGLYLFRHRDYSPIVGLWIQQDPIGLSADDSNLYRAIHDAPTTGTDPTGLYDEPDWVKKWLRPVGNELSRGPYLLVRSLYWHKIVVGLRLTGYPFTADLLEWSCQNYPPDVIVTTTHVGAVEMHTSPEFAVMVTKVIGNAPKGTFKGQEVIEWKAGDLFIAAHYAIFHYDGCKKDNNNYNMNIWISDRYDFDLNFNNWYSSGLGGWVAWTANNIAWLHQVGGYLRPFNWRTEPWVISKGSVE
jgi:RHS repeat-associated protein